MIAMAGRGQVLALADVCGATPAELNQLRAGDFVGRAVLTFSQSDRTVR